MSNMSSGNALKFTTVGCIEVGLKLMEDPKRDGSPARVCFSVVDTGIGMSKQYLKNQVFTPFVQENSLSQGTGLGLSIVDQLVHSLGGTLNIESQIGVGTSVRVIVPLGTNSSAPITPQRATTATRNDVNHDFHGRTLCYITPEACNIMARSESSLSDQARDRYRALEGVLAQLSSEVFGMRLVYATALPFPKADFYILDDLIFRTPGYGQANTYMDERLLQLSPLLVLCGAKTLPSPLLQSERLKGKIFPFHDPLGPGKLAFVLSTALAAKNRGLSTTHAAESQLPVEAGQRVTFLPPHSIKATSNELESPITSPTIEKSLPISIKTHETTPPHTQTLPDSSPVDEPPQNLPGPQHLLLVDDNHINLRVLSSIVQKQPNCTYVLALNGLEAVELFKSSPKRFDVIFMDISMPVMDGFTAIRAIRAYERELNLLPSKIIALTGLGSVDSQKEAVASGTDLFITKPVRVGEIRSLLQ
jgi:CheY-like chemotaxis protein